MAGTITTGLIPVCAPPVFPVALFAPTPKAANARWNSSPHKSTTTTRARRISTRRDALPNGARCAPSASSPACTLPASSMSCRGEFSRADRNLTPAYEPLEGTMGFCDAVGRLTNDHVPPKSVSPPTLLELRRLSDIIHRASDLP
jgi:hypothetical protein